MQRPDLPRAEVIVTTTGAVSFFGHLAAQDAATLYFLISKVITGEVPGLFVGSGRLYPVPAERIVSII